MNLRQFSERIRNMERRLAALGPAAEAPNSDPPPLMAEMVAAFGTTMEELRVAEEELHTQQDELITARQAIEAERQRFHDLFEFAPDAYLVTDLVGIIREANQGASLMLMIDKRYLIGKPIALFVVEERRPAFRTEMARVAKAGFPSQYETRLRTRHTPAFDASLSVSVIRDPKRRPSELRWILRDVSARNRALETLRALNRTLERKVAERSEDFEAAIQTTERLLIEAHAASSGRDPSAREFLDLIQGLDAIIWKADASTGRFTFVSRQAEALLGFPTERWLDEPDFWAERVHPEDREWATSNRRRSIAEGRDFESEYRMVADDGRSVWFRESVRMVPPEDGSPRELRGLMVNISKRKKVERQLHHAKGQLSAELRDMSYLQELSARLSATRELGPILEEVLAAVVSVLGAEMGILQLYDAEVDALAPAAGVGIAAAHLEHAGRVPNGRAICQGAMANGGRILIEDMDADPVAAAYHPAARLAGYRSVYGIPLFSRSGEFLGLLSTGFRGPHRPLDRQVHLVETYARLAGMFIEDAQIHREALDAIRRRDEFLSGLARELRGSVTTIDETVRTLARSGANGPTLDQARAVARSHLDQLAQCVDDLLAASRQPEPREVQQAGEPRE